MTNDVIVPNRQTVLDDEYLRASLSKELRQRERTLREITHGWVLSRTGDDGTEGEFLARNEDRLSLCEDSIRFLTDTIKSRSQQKGRLESILESLSSLDLAKGVVRRLLVELYAHKRLQMAYCEVEEPRADTSRNSWFRSSLGAAPASAEVETDLEKLSETHEKEMIAMLEMVSCFSSDASEQQSRTNEKQLAFWAEKCASADRKMAMLEESQRELQARLAAKSSEAQTFENRITELQAALQTSKAKEEAFLLLDVRCLLGDGFSVWM